jgi:hypothetical protein
MTDHYDTILVQMRGSLAGAKIMAETNWIFSADVEALEREILALEREAAIWRAKTPEQRAAEQAEREARWEAFDAACAEKDALPDDEDEDEED